MIYRTVLVPNVRVPSSANMLPVVSAMVVVVMTAVVVQFVRWFLAYRSYFLFFNRLPGETDFSWIWGNMHTFRKMSTEERMLYFRKVIQKHPKFYRLWLGPFKCIISLIHPDTVKQVLKTSEPKPPMYRFAIPWLGEGLLIANGNRWARSRRLLTPAFHFDILKPYISINNRACDILLSKIQKCVDEKTSIEIFSNISLCTLDIILQCAMSYTDDIQMKGETHPYVQAAMELTELWVERVRNPLVHFDFVYNLTKDGKRFKTQCDFVHGISEHVIKTRQESLEREGPPSKRFLDFLDILLVAKDEQGQGLTPLEIRNEVDTFMFEGHDTTASAISWILYSLAEHQEVQKKVHEELDKVLQGRVSSDIEWEDLSKLDYLTLVIKEGMRMHCPVTVIMRQLTQPVNLEGVTIPTGTTCIISLMNLHHNPLVWDDPWTFQPERFLPENMKDKDIYAFVPFSAGPRNCIGQHFAMNEEKVILSRLLRQYRFELDPSHKVEKKFAAVMRTENGMKMFAISRNSSS